MEEINSNPEILAQTQDIEGNKIVAQARRTHSRGFTCRKSLGLSATALIVWALSSCVPVQEIKEPPKTVLAATPIPEPTFTITPTPKIEAPKIEEYSRNPETILREAGLEGLIPLYKEQDEYAEKYGSAPYPNIFNDILAIAEGSASSSTIAYYNGNWGEFAASQAKIDAALEKVERVELQGFSNEFQMRRILATIARTYPTLLLATPNILIKGDINSYRSGRPQALDDRVIIPEPLLERSDKEEVVIQLGAIIHEFSHYFGGNKLNKDIVKRIKPFVFQKDFANFIAKAGESSTTLLRVYATVHSEEEIGIAYNKLINRGLSSLTSSERSIIHSFLQDGHNNTFGAEADFPLDKPIDSTDPYYDVQRDRRSAVGALFKMIKPGGEFTKDDFNPGLRLFNEFQDKSK